MGNIIRSIIYRFKKLNKSTEFYLFMENSKDGCLQKTTKSNVINQLHKLNTIAIFLTCYKNFPKKTGELNGIYGIECSNLFFILWLVIFFILYIITHLTNDLFSVNLTPFGEASQSSQVGIAGAQNAINPPVSNEWSYTSCTHTDPSKTPAWWMFNISYGPAFITDIKIYYRILCT